MAVTKLTNPSGIKVILFKYLLENLFDDVSLETLTLADKMNQKVGATEGENNMIDEIGLSDDERYQFDNFLTEGHMKVFSKLLKMTYGILDSFKLDFAGDANAVPAILPNVSVTIRDKEGYNENYLEAIDTEVYHALKHYILKEWFVKCQMTDQIGFYQDKYLKNLKDIQRYGLALRKPKSRWTTA